MNKYFYYKNFAQNVFNRLNGIVNKVNIASDIKFSLDDKYNSYAYNNNCCIIIFLNKILHDHVDDERIKPVIIDVIIHELFHIDQVIDRNIYNIDTEYTSMIEKQVIYKTSEFIISNYTDLQNIIGEFEITRFRNIYSNIIKEIVAPYERITLEKLYIDTIKSWANNDVNINLYNNIIVKYKTIDNIEYEICIKQNGIYNSDTKKFNSIILNNLFSTIRNIDLYINGFKTYLLIEFKEGDVIKRSRPIKKVGFSTR